MSHPEVILDSVRRYFEKKDACLDLVEKFGSPLYVVERNCLVHQARRFKTAFDFHLKKTGFYFAMKSNHLPYISKVLLDQGFSLDVSSGVELETALRLGALDIFFSGPGKTDKELELAVRASSCVTLLLDSDGELKRLERILSGTSDHIKVGIRVNMNPRGLWRKFGICMENVYDVWENICANRQIQFSGLQMHSSWNMDPERQVENIRAIGKFLSGMPQNFLHQVEFIDIGGGYWPSQGEWLVSEFDQIPTVHPAVGIDVFAHAIAKAFKTHVFKYVDCRVCFEPGRWICNDVMHILLQVVDRKQADLVITDGGTNIVGWERFETDYFPVLNLSRPAVKEHACHVLGSLCTPHDVWGFAFWGEDIYPGDTLMIPTQGAYTYSLRQPFIKPLPKVVVLEESLIIQDDSGFMTS